MKEQIKKIITYGIIALSALSFGGCVAYQEGLERSRKYWENVRQENRTKPSSYEVSKQYWENVRQENIRKRNNHRHYPSVNEKLQERAGTYFLFKGLEGLESLKK